MNLQEANWLEYHLYDLFDIDTGNKFDKSKMTAIDPSIDFVGRSSTRNGVTAYVDYIEGVTPYAEGSMTLALGGEHLGSCFIQNHPFYTSQNVFVLTPKETMSGNVKIFISHIIRNESKNNYMAFARELNAHVKSDFCIKLPSISKGKLDYQFMDEFIELLKCDFSTIPDYFLDEGYDKAFWYLENIDQELFETTYAAPLSNKNLCLTDREWKTFQLGDIVDDIHNGKAYNASELIVSDSEDYIAYVTRTDKNNGIALFVQNNDYIGLEQGNAITIGDTTATIYYQTTQFITGPHIIVIRAEWFNIYTATFLITLLNNEKYRYPVFGRSFSKDLISDTNISLPITKDDCPDYEFMENYIKQCSFSCNIK